MIINIRAVTGVLGMLLFFLGVALLLPTGVGLFYGEEIWRSFGTTALIGMVGGTILWSLYRQDIELQIREGFVIVALAWFVLSLIGALPFVLGGVLDSYTNAFFETVSGFTTTGATIFGGAETPDIESLPNALLLWRSLTHWMGGMGIIVLALAIMPLLGIGGMQLFKAEVPGPSVNKLTPRVRETAKQLWFIYAGITALEVLLLLPEMSLFDATNHAFSTMATGGFSTENGSIGQYDSAYIDWVIIVFMYLAGVNFALHVRLLRGETKPVFASTELRTYTGIILAAMGMVVLATYEPTGRLLTGGMETSYTSLIDALRYAAFQVVAITTTTGFGTADYEIWPVLALTMIFLLFFSGGMAGSTAGGIKTMRHVLLAKDATREIKQLIHPKALLPVRLDGQVVSDPILRNVLTFFVLYLATLAAGTFIMAWIGLDLVSALGAAMSCLGNIGPAFGTLGPTDNYAHVSSIGKWVLTFLMIVGRLEIYTVLVIFAPAFWKR